MNQIQLIEIMNMTRAKYSELDMLRLKNQYEEELARFSESKNEVLDNGSIGKQHLVVQQINLHNRMCTYSKEMRNYCQSY